MIYFSHLAINLIVAMYFLIKLFSVYLTVFYYIYKFFQVLKYLDEKISVETTDDNGNSLLHIAAANGHEEIVRLLSMKGNNSN